MARVPVITRTITTTDAKILCVNPTTRELVEITKTLPRTYADDAAIMKYIEKNDVFAGEDVKPVSVITSTVGKKLYKMLESEFVEKATPCTDEEAKAIEAEEGSTETDNAENGNEWA